MMVGKLGIQKNETRPLSLTIYKYQLKMDKRFKYKTPNYKTTRGTMKEALQDIGIGEDFLLLLKISKHRK
jgi:hypothetical protein